MEPSPSWEAKNVQLLKNFPTFYGTRTSLVPSLSQINPVHTVPFPQRIYERSYIASGARSSVVGSGTMQQAVNSRVRIPMRSMDF
jgi:hypothetical protein